MKPEPPKAGTQSLQMSSMADAAMASPRGCTSAGMAAAVLASGVSRPRWAGCVDAAASVRAASAAAAAQSKQLADMATAAAASGASSGGATATSVAECHRLQRVTSAALDQVAAVPSAQESDRLRALLQGVTVVEDHFRVVPAAPLPDDLIQASGLEMEMDFCFGVDASIAVDDGWLVC